ncbi:MAG: hypothetical protein AAGA10_06780 [Bacteroidota bacterium]
MKRKEVPQFINQRWVPQLFKDLVYEFMTWFVGKIHAAKPFMPILNEALTHTHSNAIVAIDHGIGAGFETVEPYLEDDISVEQISIDQFKAEQSALYVSVNGFHQLSPDRAAHLLQEVAHRKHPIAILEGNNDSLWQVVGMLVFVPLTVILTAPFVKPFRVTRLLFTYVIPILPLLTLMDGFLALFKLYNPKDLQELYQSLEVPNYRWRSGKRENGRGGKIMYLLGWPE